MVSRLAPRLSCRLSDSFSLKTALQGGENVFTTGLILQELLQGFNGPKARRKIIETFASLPFIIPERRDYIAAADLKVKLRQKGIQAGTIDVLLAQLCLRHGLSLLSVDKDFAHMTKYAPLSLLYLSARIRFLWLGDCFAELVRVKGFARQAIAPSLFSSALDSSVADPVMIITGIVDFMA